MPQKASKSRSAGAGNKGSPGRDASDRAIATLTVRYFFRCRPNCLGYLVDPALDPISFRAFLGSLVSDGGQLGFGGRDVGLGGRGPLPTFFLASLRARAPK